MGPAFDKAAFVEDGDDFGAGDGAEAVRDGEGGAADLEFFQGFLDETFAVGVEGAGGFVEDEDLWIGDDGAGDAEPLALATGEAGAAFADRGVIALG